MPGFVKTKEDERLWAKAKGLAEDQGKKENWAYITGIFKKMKGGKVGGMNPDYEFKSGPAAKAASALTLADRIAMVAAAHPTHEDALLDIIKEASGARAYGRAQNLAVQAATDLDKAARILSNAGARALAGAVDYAAETASNVSFEIKEAAEASGNRQAAGWVPGELKENWDPGRVDTDPSEGFSEDGSQVPPSRDNFGQQIDDDGNPVDSITRIPSKSASVEDEWAALVARTHPAT